MPKHFCWATGVVLCVLARVCAAAITIDKALPFTPTTDSVRIEVNASGDGAADAKLTGTITPWQKKEVVWQGPIKPGQTIDHLKVQPWSPGSPNLYELTVTATPKAGEAVSKTVRFGFRQVESRDGHVILNGHPIFLRGLAINPPGRTVPETTTADRKFAYDYIKYLKSQNLNLIRCSDASDLWFEVCDELGMMVYQGFYGSPPTGMSKEEEASARLETQAEGEGKRLPKNFDRSVAAYKAEFETYVHHPSIVIYILSNEMPYRGKTGEEVHQFLSRAYDVLSKWDRTRLYIGNAGYGEGHEGDINDVHRYWGWYYNSFATYYNVRDPKLFGDPEKNQPFTFSECVGNFTGPNGAYNLIERKQLAAAMTWVGYDLADSDEAQAYQAFMTKQATESFRRMRAVNPRISGLMPFTITFHNWRGVTSFDQMKPTAAAKQFGVSYQPVLLSFENWQPNVYAGKKATVFAHVVNDADDFKDLTDAKIEWEFGSLRGNIAVPTVRYYGTWTTAVELTPPKEATGEIKLIGRIVQNGKTIATNETAIFVGGAINQTKPQRSGRQIKASADNNLDPANDLLVIEEQSWDRSFAAKEDSIKKFVQAGGRVLCLGQDYKQFETDWLPAKIEMNEPSLNDPEYGSTMKRPARDGMNVNIEHSDHPAFAGIDRRQLKLWSDTNAWDQTKPGFPDCYPIRSGFRLSTPDDLKNVAVLADYDQGLSAVALAEMFEGKGSVMLCGFGIKARQGIDPVADRLRQNLVAYMGSDEPHQRHPLVKQPIRWGDGASQQGVISGPINGLFVNTMWLPPPTEPDAKPITKAQGGWNTRPSDQFVPHGVRPRGPFSYTFNCAPRDGEKDSKIGSGIFYATTPAGRTKIVNKVENPTKEAAELKVEVNGRATSATIPPGKTIDVEAPIREGATDVGVRFTGDKELVILETRFE